MVLMASNGTGMENIWFLKISLLVTVVEDPLWYVVFFPTGVQCSFKWCRFVKQRRVTSECCKNQL